LRGLVEAGQGQGEVALGLMDILINSPIQGPTARADDLL
jgi:hypothetical protein